MSVFFKPVPVCNFAQTPCLAAVALARDKSFDSSKVASVEVSASRAAKAYPGCDYPGLFARGLQAKEHSIRGRKRAYARIGRRGELC